MTMTEDTTGDIFDRRKDGRILLRFDGTEYLLRMPKLGEYKQLKLDLVDISADLETLMERVKAEAAAASAEVATLDDESSDDEIDKVRKTIATSLSAMGVQNEQDAIVGEFIVTVISLLNGAKLTVDDLPPWMVQADANGSQIINAMFGHWRAVPLGLGK